MTNEKITTEKKKPALRLLGTDGNAFSILGKAKQAWREAGLSTEEWKTINDEMTSGDYNHLLGTAMKYFDVA